MPSDSAVEEFKAKLTEEWDVRGIEVATLVHDPKGTIRGAGLPQTARFARGSTTDLPELVTADTVKGKAAELEIGDTLGEGGMGIVWLGKQVPLRREVAIKSVHPKVKQAETARALLREARITGALEHPNVVPIHALGKDERGRPLIVMKRIEGSSWQKVIDNQRNDGPGVVMSQLDHHARVLVDVAKAVGFAHSRGIVHRDIKPDNVMIGAFGEVYLVDWGIAVGTRPSDDLEMPLAKDVSEVAGSPAYMAPEMASGDGDNIDGRTDVYLLGATLHEILTGNAPHEANTTVLMLTHAYASPPFDYDASIPPGLAEICNTAMAREPRDRFQTAASFAAALQRFMEHRDSTLLTDESLAKLETLREAIDVGTSDPERKQSLYNLFNETRFGFQSALRIWESNTRAREGLQTALELMIGFELDHGSSGAAAALLGALPLKNNRLASRVDDKREAERQAHDQLDQLKAEVDETGADLPRAYLAFFVAATWPALHAILWWVDTRTMYAIGHLELAAAYALYAIGALAIGVAARETFFARARFGAQTQLTITLCYAGLSAMWLICDAIGVSVQAGFTLSFFMGAILWSVGALAVDRRMLTFAIAMFAGLGVMLVHKQHGILWMGAAGTLGSSVMGWLRYRTTSPSDAQPLSQQWSRAQVEESMRAIPPTEKG